MLEKLKLSKSGYYDYVNRKPSNQKKENRKLAKKIKSIHEESYDFF